MCPSCEPEAAANGNSRANGSSNGTVNGDTNGESFISHGFRSSTDSQLQATPDSPPSRPSRILMPFDQTHTNQSAIS
jgi:hypothetical protein